MTVTCREACCSVTPRFTVSELFERGFRRSRDKPFAIEGETVRDAEGNSARFSLELDGGKLAGLRFRVSSCTTLIAYSEALAELLPGLDAGLAAHFTPAELVVALPGVPALKQNRAVLAVAALRAALLATESRHPEVAAKRPSQGDARSFHQGSLRMKVAYIFATSRHTVSYVLGKMILPQLEENRHGVDVAGMFFFEDNNYVLVKGNPIGARLHKVAKEKGILLMGCDQCCYEREIADILFDGVPIGCFPDLYKALSGNMPDQVITL